MCRGSLLRCASTNDLMTLHAHRHTCLHPQEIVPNGNGLCVTIASCCNIHDSLVSGDGTCRAW